MENCYEYLHKKRGWHPIKKIAVGLGYGSNGVQSITRSLKAIMYYGDIYAKSVPMSWKYGVRYQQVFCHERWIK